MVQLLELPIVLKPRPVARRIGLIMLETDHTAELEFARHLPLDEVGIYTNRIEYANPTTPENLRAMLPHIGNTARMILPDADLDVIYYGCTSASVVIGNQAIVDAINKVKPGANVITPTISALEAFATLKLNRISILTPYLPETSRPVEPFFEKKGISVINHVCLGMEDDRDMARLDDDTIVSAAIAADHDNADALFISCTAVPAVAVAGRIERAIGKPVITSNQAAVWHTLKLLDLGRPARNKCQLFDTLKMRDI